MNYRRVFSNIGRWQQSDFPTINLKKIESFIVGRWTVIVISTTPAQHNEYITWATNSFGLPFLGVKTGIFRFFYKNGRWSYESVDVTNYVPSNLITKSYWFREPSDFDMFRLTWYDVL